MTGRRRTAGVAGAVVALLSCACSGEAPPEGEPVDVFADVGLAGPLEEIHRFARSDLGVRIRPNYGKSSELAKEIDAGAEAELFVSANPLWTRWLVTRDRAYPASEVVLVENTLVLVSPPDQTWTFDPAGSASLVRAFPGKIALGDPERVPVGGYAKDALAHRGWWMELQSRVVSAPDARAALMAVERGDCDAGIVYASDARGSELVRIVAAIPESWHEPIVYPLVIVAGDEPDASRALWQLLLGEHSADVFRRHGFRVPARTAAPAR